MIHTLFTLLWLVQLCMKLVLAFRILALWAADKDVNQHWWRRTLLLALLAYF